MHDHICWGYEHPEEFVAGAVEFLADGLDAGLQVCYVAPGTTEELTAALSSSGRLRRALDTGAARVVSLDGMYGNHELSDPRRQVTEYAEATNRAQAAGYKGLRIAAEATGLVDTPERLDAFVRYEYLVDEYMVDHPFSALCAYNVAELGHDAVAQLACLHPVSNDGTQFRLHATGPPHTAAVSGELDMATAQLWPRALERAQLRPVDGWLRFDAAGLRFVDHRSLAALDSYAAQRNVGVLLTSASPLVVRMAQILRLQNVRAHT
ncbi:hypothetical protein FOS14_11975 [Skermania sp. ID1734]|nr:hypothetical protein FOS14_11975 [Skermania sp. ID1734]